MRRTIRENINAAYSLHDMNVFAFDVDNNKIMMRTQSGMVKTTPPYEQPDGYVEFYDVDWDFSYAYLFGFNGNVGPFTGTKMFLRDFINEIKVFGFTIMDETYGYNTTKYSGYLLFDRQHCECMIEIYHKGDMVFVTEE